MSELLGRVIFYGGRNKTEPSSHISDAEQPFPFVVGPVGTSAIKQTLETDSQHEIVCASPSILTRVLLPLFEKRWLVRQVVLRHQRFYFVTFARDTPGLDPVRATWNNLLELVKKESPPCYNLLLPHMEDIRGGRPFDSYKVDGYGINNLPKEIYDRVKSFEAFAKLSRDIVTPGYARAFFRHTLKCTALFRGDGYTYDEYGIRGFDEYVVRNMPLSELTQDEPRQLNVEFGYLDMTAAFVADSVDLVAGLGADAKVKEWWEWWGN
jgi:hypothetical protein